MARTAAITVRVEPHVKQGLEEAAARVQRKQADFINRLFIDYLEGRLVPTGGINQPGDGRKSPPSPTD